MITCSKKQQSEKQESLTEALTRAVLAFAKVITPSPSVFGDQIPTYIPYVQYCL